MKRLKYLLLTILCVVMAGCGNGNVSPVTDVEPKKVTENNTLGQEEAVDITVTPDNPETENMVETEDTADITDAAEATDITEVPGMTEASDSTESVVFETKYISIDLSMAKESYAEGEAVTPFNLKIVSKEDNGIDWAYEWYENKNLSLPMIGHDWDFFYDEAYEYLWSRGQLSIFDRETSNCLYILDYPTDFWYVNGNNAYLKDGIFYGASVYNGYAEPDTCFMFAYDLENEKLLWRSADQSYNTMNFVVKGDIILCGYGFTAEKDYLYQINRNTGEIIDRLELVSMPDLIVEQDGKLYVHTYNCNYVIEIE